MNAVNLGRLAIITVSPGLNVEVNALPIAVETSLAV